MIDKSITMSAHAQDLQERADRIGSGGISSDDPEAIQKLEAKLLGCQDGHAIMIERNREARATGQPKPYATWQLSNSNNNIRSIRERIEQLQRQRSMAAELVKGAGWEMVVDIDDNRIMFKFDKIPDEATRKLLKSRAFKWSPTRKAWVRQLTPNARFAADQIAELFK
jgi:hypothetical protein